MSSLLLKIFEKGINVFKRNSQIMKKFRISKLNLPFTVSYPASVAILSLISTPFILPISP